MADSVDPSTLYVTVVLFDPDNRLRGGWKTMGAGLVVVVVAIITPQPATLCLIFLWVLFTAASGRKLFAKGGGLLWLL